MSTTSQQRANPTHRRISQELGVFSTTFLKQHQPNVVPPTEDGGVDGGLHVLRPWQGESVSDDTLRTRQRSWCTHNRVDEDTSIVLEQLRDNVCFPRGRGDHQRCVAGLHMTHNI